MFLFQKSFHSNIRHNSEEKTSDSCQLQQNTLNISFNLGLRYTLKNAGLFQPKFGSNMDKPKCWVQNAIFESES